MRRRALPLLVLLTAAVRAGAQCAPAAADEAELRAEVARLHADVAQLEAMLERRVAARPAGAAAVPVPAAAGAVAGGAAVGRSADDPGPGPGVSRRRAWAGVHEGQSVTDVEALLGSPQKRFELGGREVSYYAYPDGGSGSVFFDGSGRVSSLQRPAG